MKETLYTSYTWSRLKKKLETKLPILKDVNNRNWNVLSVKGMIFTIVTAKILYTKQNKKESSEHISVRQ